MTIPFVDLRTQCAEIHDELLEAIEQVVGTAQFILGDEVAKFEADFAEFCSTKHAVGVASGTDALHLALRALGIGPGDEVLTVANTFAATAFAISYTGADCVFLDVREDDYTMDVALIEQAITPRTKAILPVHLYGHPAQMGPIQAIAEKYGLRIVEDACQAHGATYDGMRVGALGDAGCFSFYPGKNLGALGDGGAIVTNNGALAERLRSVRNYGQKVKNVHTETGYNSRLDTLQAAILLVKLKHLPRWTEQRRAAALQYCELLRNSELILPAAAEDVEHVYHLFVVRHRNRDALAAHLNEHGVSTGLHYPQPLHQATPFQHARTVPPGLPVTSRISGEILSLPMFPEITPLQLQTVAESVASYPAYEMQP